MEFKFKRLKKQRKIRTKLQVKTENKRRCDLNP